MKKAFAIFIAAAMAAQMCSCGASDSSSSAAESSSKAAESTAVSQQESSQEETFDISGYADKISACKLDDDNFKKYTSNTVVSTGNNYVVDEADKITYRAYFPVEQAGKLEYRFYFSNTVDSTYDKTGRVAFVGKDGGEYTIESAYIADGGESVDDEITNKTQITFGGEGSKEVSPNEQFWSDAAEFDVPEGHYLVWEWTLTGTDIPCTKMATLTSSTSLEVDEYTDEEDAEFAFCDEIPLPQLIGAKRDVKASIAAIGDSITQGCQTEFMKYEYWSARISQNLGSDYSLWNCGLGWSRSSDAAECGNWLARAAQYDTVIVAFGTNDIISGKYGDDKKSTAAEIDGYIRVILEVLKNNGCKVIVFNAPPQTYDEELEAVRTSLNERLKKTCEEYGAEYFDFASYLSTPDDPVTAIYGGHPNGEAGKIVADAFTERFKDSIG